MPPMHTKERPPAKPHGQITPWVLRIKADHTKRANPEIMLVMPMTNSIFSFILSANVWALPFQTASARFEIGEQPVVGLGYGHAQGETFENYEPTSRHGQPLPKA